MTSGSRPPAMNAYNMRNIAKRMEQFQVSPSDIRHMLQWADYIEEWAALKEAPMPSQDALRDALKEMRALVTAAVHLGRWQGGNGIHAAILKADAALDAPEPEPTTSDAEFLCDMANLMELSWRPEFKDVHVGGSQATIKRLREIADRLEPCTVPEPVTMEELVNYYREGFDQAQERGALSWMNGGIRAVLAAYDAAGGKVIDAGE